MDIQEQKEFKQVIEEVFHDYSRASKRHLARSERILRFRNLAGAPTSSKMLLGEIIEKAVVMEHTTPPYYFMGGYGNEGMENPDYDSWRQNSLNALGNLARSTRG